MSYKIYLCRECGKPCYGRLCRKCWGSNAGNRRKRYIDNYKGRLAWKNKKE